MTLDRRSTDVVWQRGMLTRDRRWSRLATRGATVWITGLPGSGKSTVGATVEARLVEDGRSAYLLDGDNLRHGLNNDLGFDESGRTENVRRAAQVARLFADAGAIALVSLVSPYAAGRAEARELHERDGLPFLEVWMSTPLEVCEQRDPKGLYSRARTGRVANFTGVSHPYEAPQTPDLELGPSLDAARCADLVLDALGHAGAL